MVSPEGPISKRLSSQAHRKVSKLWVDCTLQNDGEMFHTMGVWLDLAQSHVQWLQQRQPLSLDLACYHHHHHQNFHLCNKASISRHLHMRMAIPQQKLKATYLGPYSFSLSLRLLAPFVFFDRFLLDLLESLTSKFRILLNSIPSIPLNNLGS